VKGLGAKEAPRAAGAFDLVLERCRLPDGPEADIGCRDGRIAEIGGLRGRAAKRAVDCEGRVVTPGLVETHIDLDKALLADRAPSIEGTRGEAIRVTGLAKRGFTVEDIRARARRVLDLAVLHATAWTWDVARISSCGKPSAPRT
jgi:cytosine/creatinine deaminase